MVGTVTTTRLVELHATGCDCGTCEPYGRRAQYETAAQPRARMWRTLSEDDSVRLAAERRHRPMSATGQMLDEICAEVAELRKECGILIRELSEERAKVADLTALVGILLPKCKTCGAPATRGYPTAELGYFVRGCDAHPQGPDHCEFSDQDAYELRWADAVRRLAGTLPAAEPLP
jgi:hypothetical protein